jgi:hypothetical protein
MYKVERQGIMRKLFLFCMLVLLVWGGIYTYNRMTDGFSLRQMTSSLPPCPHFEISLTPEKKESLQSKLDQPFHYIGKGCQFYVFASADDKYVLKFLKHKHLRPSTWLNALPMPESWHKHAQAKIMRRHQRVERLFSSCKLAYEKMAEETGLLYIHLNRTPALGKQVVLVDKMGFKRRVDIDNYEYVIQKKGVSVREVFAHLTPGEVPTKVALLVDLVKRRHQKGICDRDRSFVQNVAFTPEGDKAFFIDIGQFYEDPAILDAEQQAQELAKRLGNLHFWMERQFPQLSGFVK